MLNSTTGSYRWQTQEISFLSSRNRQRNACTSLKILFIASPSYSSCILPRRFIFLPVFIVLSVRGFLVFLCVTLTLQSVFHRPDDGGSTHLWNVGQLQHVCTVLHPRRIFNFILFNYIIDMGLVTNAILFLILLASRISVPSLKQSFKILLVFLFILYCRPAIYYYSWSCIFNKLRRGHFHLLSYRCPM
jgi:hypothetical protein